VIGQASNDHRRLIPRWRQFGRTAESGELSHEPLLHPGKLRTPLNVGGRAIGRGELTDDLKEKLISWKHQPSIETASELVAAGIVCASEAEAAAAADYLLVHRESATPSNIALADRVIRNLSKSVAGFQEENLVGDDEMGLTLPPQRQNVERMEIAEYRKSLILEPRNPIAWVQMALSYTNLGQNLHAERAMRRALQLAPHDRYVLRSMTRLLVHISRADEAHDLLKRNDRTPHDPWLLASEIATSSIAGQTC
jgi:tetratricopeptide (TPR) repeat protein